MIRNKLKTSFYRISGSFLLSLMLIGGLRGQEPVNYTQQVVYGVYRTMAEFRANRPSVTEAFRPVYRGDYLRLPPDKVSIRGADGEFVTSKEHFWGFCDSTGFYIYRKGFNKLDQVGRYCVFEGLKKNLLKSELVYKYINLIENKFKQFDYILDTGTGEITKSSRKAIKKILKADPELARDFSRNGKKEDVYIYINRYNKKHQITYPIAL